MKNKVILNLLLTYLFSLVAPGIKGLLLLILKCLNYVPMLYEEKIKHNLLLSLKVDRQNLGGNLRLEGVTLNQFRITPGGNLDRGVIWNCYTGIVIREIKLAYALLICYNYFLTPGQFNNWAYYLTRDRGRNFVFFFNLINEGGGRGPEFWRDRR